MGLGNQLSILPEPPSWRLPDTPVNIVLRRTSASRETVPANWERQLTVPAQQRIGGDNRGGCVELPATEYSPPGRPAAYALHRSAAHGSDAGGSALSIDVTLK